MNRAIPAGPTSFRIRSRSAAESLTSVGLMLSGGLPIRPNRINFIPLFLRLWRLSNRYRLLTGIADIAYPHNLGWEGRRMLERSAAISVVTWAMIAVSLAVIVGMM